jgi:hypothetical protein
MRRTLLSLLLVMLILTACRNSAPTSSTPQTTAPAVTPEDLAPTPMDQGEIAVFADLTLLSGVGENPFEALPYVNPDAPQTRTLKLEIPTYILTYRDSGVGMGIDGDLDRYVGGENGEISVWYRAGSDEIVSLELTTETDYANDGEAALKVKAANLLEDICDLDLKSMERSYTYIPKVPAQHERLATVRYDVPREDGRSYCSAVVDFHSSLISIVITNRPEPPEKELEELLLAAGRLDDYLIHTRAQKTPGVTAVSADPLPDVYYKDGKWVLETKRTVTYLVGKNEMTASMTFYLWAV